MWRNRDVEQERFGSRIFTNEDDGKACRVGSMPKALSLRRADFQILKTIEENFPNIGNGMSSTYKGDGQ
jgi:hypothetical protein